MLTEIFNRFHKLKLSARMTLFTVCSLAASLSLVGCVSPWSTDDDGFGEVSFEEGETSTRRSAIREALESEDRPRVISEIGSYQQLTLSPLENIGLVTGLRGTGGAVDASTPRDSMLRTMATHEVDQPQTFLDSPSTAMVVAFSQISPAARKGTLFDVSVKLSQHANATDLKDGWLMDTGLQEMRRIGGQVKQGFEYAKAQGPLITLRQILGDAAPEDAELQAVILGGARLLKSRQVSIGIEDRFADAITMSAIVPAINKRFTYHDGYRLSGVATPKDNSRIELEIPKKYRRDPYHFVNVVLGVGFNETSADFQTRMETLSRQLFEPITTRDAAWQLEAIGEKAIPVLKSALTANNAEVRFYAAHALAYLNDESAVEPLGELAKQEPAFRAMALNGLMVIENYAADDKLNELLHAADAETRYGALLALREKDATNPLVMSQKIGEIGNLLEIPTTGPPLVVVSTTQTPEVVIFGDNPVLSIPSFHYIDDKTIIKPIDGNRLSINRFETGKEDRIVQSASDLRSVLRAIADVGGTYGNWVSFIREAQEKSYLLEPAAQSPIPRAGRKYEREKAAAASSTENMEPGQQLWDETVINEISEMESEAEDSRLWYNPLTW